MTPPHIQRCDNNCIFQDNWKDRKGRLCSKNCKTKTRLTGLIEISNKEYQLISEIGCSSYKEDKDGE